MNVFALKIGLHRYHIVYLAGPVEHHFFKLDKKERVLLHSREEDTNPKHIEKLKLLSVQPSPSLTIRNRLDYSPHDLHRYAFCIITSHTGPMDVLAYTDRAYNGWMRELTKLCQQQEAAVDNKNHLLNANETDDFSVASVQTSSPGWTENSFVSKPFQQTPMNGNNSHFFSSSTPVDHSGGLRQSLTAQHKLSSQHMMVEESNTNDTIHDSSMVMGNPTLLTSTPHKSQPDHLPFSVTNSNNDDIV